MAESRKVLILLLVITAICLSLTFALPIEGNKSSFGQAFDEIVVESTLMVKGKSASGAAAAREGRGQSSATLVNNATDGVRVQGLRSSHKIE